MTEQRSEDRERTMVDNNNYRLFTHKRSQPVTERDGRCILVLTVLIYVVVLHSLDVVSIALGLFYNTDIHHELRAPHCLQYTFFNM